MENNEQSDNERNGTIRGYFAFKSKGEWQTNTVFIDHVLSRRGEQQADRHRRWEQILT